MNSQMTHYNLVRTRLVEIKIERLFSYCTTHLCCIIVVDLLLVLNTCSLLLASFTPPNSNAYILFKALSIEGQHDSDCKFLFGFVLRTIGNLIIDSILLSGYGLTQ